MATKPTSMSLGVGGRLRTPRVVPDTHEIVESVVELVAATGVDGILTYANPTFLKKLGIPANPLSRPKVKLEMLSAITSLPIDREILSETMQLGSWSGECELLCQDGGSLPVRMRTGRICGENGETTGVHYIASDLTEERENERQLQLLSSIVQCSGAAIVGQTVEGIIFSWNKEAERLFGYAAREILGKSSDLVLPFDRKGEGLALLEKLNRGERVQQFESVRLRRDGQALQVSMTMAPILDRNGEVVGSSMALRDNSETRKMEAQLKNALRFESTGRLAAGIAHEFNNVHSVILGYCDILSEMSPQEKRSHYYVEQIRKATQRAASVIQQLLAFSQRQVLEPRIIDLPRTITAMESLIKNLLGEAVLLKIQNSAASCHVKADPTQIEQAILKLAMNGRKAMPKGGTLFIRTENVVFDETHRVQHAYIPEGEYCLLTISDTGVGIDEAAQANIFEPFRTTAGQDSGSGFGLAVVYGIVKQSGGYINLDSEMGAGTTFRIYLPTVHQSVSSPSAGFPLMSLPRGTETVLLVDDDQAFRKINRILLEEFGYTVVEAASGPEALELAAGFAGAIDLLLTDVIMPAMDGPTLAKQLGNVRPRMRKLYMSGFTSDRLITYFGEASGATLLVKPFSRSTLALKVWEALEESSPTEVRGVA